MEVIKKYFPDLKKIEIEKIISLYELFKTHNKHINLISKNSLNNFFTEHILHSLSINKIKLFKKNQVIIDVGSGGGFPGLPLSIINPTANFVLVDSVSKKTNMIQKFKSELSLKNIEIINDRIENLNISCDFIISRAVTNMNNFLFLIRNIKFFNNKINNHNLFYLKGGDLKKELEGIAHKSIEISNYYDEKYFKEKKIICVKGETIFSHNNK